MQPKAVSSDCLHALYVGDVERFSNFSVVETLFVIGVVDSMSRRLGFAATLSRCGISVVTRFAFDSVGSKHPVVAWYSRHLSLVSHHGSCLILAVPSSPLRLTDESLVG